MIYYSFVKQLSKPETLRLCSAVGRKIIVSAAKSVFDGLDGDFNFAEGEHGKPYLTEHPELHFSISHSGNLVTAAVSDGEVGIDCEKIRKINLKVAEKHFTEAELNYINREPDKTQKRFFEVWTAKEAYLKKIGAGLTVPPRCVNTAEMNFFRTELRDCVITVCTDNASAFEIREFCI